MSAPAVSAGYTVYEDPSISPIEQGLLGTETLKHFAHFAGFSTNRTKLFFVKVCKDGRLCGVAPVIRLWKNRSTDLLAPSSRRWMGPLLGPLSRKTTYMVDNAFLAFQYRSPFFCTDAANTDELKVRISDYLKSKRDADTIWISEPVHEARWARAHGYDVFRILPMVHVDISGRKSVDQHLQSLSKKRRRNIHHDQELFARHGGVIDVLESPIKQEDALSMFRLVRASSERSWITVPYDDVLNNETAFVTQPQTAIVARVNGTIVGFVSYVSEGKTLLQCHGGLDYNVSLEVKAYHNLLSASIKFAIDRGFERVSFGPLNNETKRRAGTEFMPMAASLWSRSRFQGFFTRSFVIPNMQVYTGSYDASGCAD